MYLYILSRELALTCFSVTVLLWLVALRYGAFTRKAQRAYQDGLAETNEVQLSLSSPAFVWALLARSVFQACWKMPCTCHLVHQLSCALCRA